MSNSMLVSVIICTYRRAGALGDLLDCLVAQAYRNFEVIIVDGSGEDPTVRRKVEDFVQTVGNQIELRLITSPKGLTRQRNLGLRESHGDIVCFFDDDITINNEFLSQVVELFQQPDMQDVGGISGYDTVHYSRPITSRWRLRRWLGSIPSLEPGDVDNLGRSVPLGFVKPQSGRKSVGWLPGCCMIYRRAAVSGLHFDEELPTYAGEDVDFSIEVGRRWRLLLDSELLLSHHISPDYRDSGVQRVYQTGFGLGRGFAKRVERPFDYLTIARFVAAEFIMDALALAKGPSADKIKMVFARPVGIIAGFKSFRKVKAPGVTPVTAARGSEER
jgi:glycosyltransferase involved in cell wall biosynthesis